jgi:putative ABC transport system ATP-binding protein
MVRVLERASLDVHVGELVAVLAGRGEGKTSLLRMAAGIKRPEGGEVLFKGRDLWTLSDKRRSELLRHEIGFAELLGPDIDLPALTHVALPLFPDVGHDQAYDCALSLLDRMRLREFADQPWTGLADSERALVVLAQSLVRKPDLLLVDNLTATLGIRETEELGRLLRSIAEEDGLAVLMCVSDAEASTWCDRVATLGQGRLVAPPPKESPRKGSVVVDFPGGSSTRAASDA